MKVPLSVIPLDDSLVVYRNGEAETVPFPFKPFAMVDHEKVPMVGGKKEIWTKVPEDEQREYVKAEFANMTFMNDFKKMYSNERQFIRSTGYLEQLFVTKPDFLLNYPNTNNLKVLFFDIEVCTRGDGIFPKPNTSPILCIGYSVWEYFPDGSKTKIYHDLCKGFDIESESDASIIDKFADGVAMHDPDIIAGYNSALFDFPYLIERAKIMRCDLTKISRGSREPTIYQNGETTEIRIPGRIHFDIYASNAGVIKDQTLFGIKSKTLKELARFYKAKRTSFVNNEWVESEMDDIELPGEIMNLIKLFNENPDRLYAYQDDDVYRTEAVGNVYLRNCITLAEMIQVPLANIINMFSSFVPKIFIARKMEELRLINTQSNFARYNIATGTIAQVGTKYEGAVVGLYKDGYFPATWKLDFASQYPSSIETWNLGPDTTKLVKVEPYSGKYTAKIQGNYTWYRIPTYFEKRKYGYDFIVRVRRDKDGFLKQSIRQLKTERKKIKAEMKAATGDSVAALNSQQIAIKVIMNSIYGFLGLKSSTYGEMISAVMVTAMCRWCILKCMQRNENCLVETDTDGIVVDKFLNADEENKWLDKHIRDKFHVLENTMELELEGNGERAYFYLMKNYVMEDEPGKYSIHGSSLKSSRAAKVIDRAHKLGIEYIFNDKPIEEVINEAYNFKNLTIDDFVERVKLSKEPREYDDQYDSRLFLAKQVELKTGQVMTKGAQISYVITKDQLPFKELKPYYKDRNYTFVDNVDDVSEIDFKYYEAIVDKSLKKFGIDKLAWSQIDLFLDESAKKKPIKPKNKKLDTVPKDEL